MRRNLVAGGDPEPHVGIGPGRIAVEDGDFAAGGKDRGTGPPAKRRIVDRRRQRPLGSGTGGLGRPGRGRGSNDEQYRKYVTHAEPSFTRSGARTAVRRCFRRACAPGHRRFPYPPLRSAGEVRTRHPRATAGWRCRRRWSCRCWSPARCRSGADNAGRRPWGRCRTGPRRRTAASRRWRRSSSG